MAGERCWFAGAHWSFAPAELAAWRRALLTGNWNKGNQATGEAAVVPPPFSGRLSDFGKGVWAVPALQDSADE